MDKAAATPWPAVSKSHLARPMLVISVLGGVELSCAGQKLRLASRRAQALLACLALSETGAARRERLASLFWGETPEERARASLRRVLSDLREALEAVGFDGLTATRHEVRLALQCVSLDTSEILRSVSAGSVPPALTAQPPLPETMLAGYDDLGTSFREWITAERHGFHGRLRRALEQACGNPALSTCRRRRLAEAAMALDPLDEAACRTVMQCAAEAGETGVALRAYARLYEAMGTELDMEPAAATQALVAAIKQGRLATIAPTSAATPAVARPGPAVPATAPCSAVPLLAVLPFRMLGQDGQAPPMVEGLREDVVRELAALREPGVISGHATRSFHGDSEDMASIGRRLGVRYLVSGTVRVVASRLRLSIELADAATGALLWGHAYDAVEALLFEAQDQIAASIAHTLAPRVHEAELRTTRGRPLEEMSAYHLVQRARELLYRLERGSFDRAGALLHAAVGRDPGYAASHAATATWYCMRLIQGWSPDPVADSRALEAAAQAAIRLDATDARSLALLGHSRTVLRRDYGQALNLLDRALQASPNDAEAWMWSSPTHAYTGDTKEAVRRAERAMLLSPQDPFLFRHQHVLSMAHYTGRDYEAAAHWGLHSLRGNPHLLSNLRMTAAALAAQGRTMEARPLVETVLRLQPGFRVRPLLARLAFRNDQQRELYGKHLQEAGLPF